MMIKRIDSSMQSGLPAALCQQTNRCQPRVPPPLPSGDRSEEHTSELQSRRDLVCRLLLEKKKNIQRNCSENHHDRQTQTQSRRPIPPPRGTARSCRPPHRPSIRDIRLPVFFVTRDTNYAS